MPILDKFTTRPRLIAGMLIQAAIYTVLVGLILFLAAGTTDWPAAWVFLAMYFITVAASRAMMIWINPDLAMERAQSMNKKDAKPWDRALMPFVALIGPLIIYLSAGLEQRLGRPPALSWAVILVALGVGVLGAALGGWAMIANKFFSGTVRIQSERGHSVCDSGPYRFVRHPGYLGGVLFHLATPFMLCSWWAFLPVALVTAALVIRTALEDRTLQAELPGYAEYAQRVRSRLIPGIW